MSGSGPAYVFLMVEALTEAGVPKACRAPLARKAGPRHGRGRGRVAGGRQVARQPTCAEAVTSPGGTTEAALKVLMAKDGLRLMKRAVARRAQTGGRVAIDIVSRPRSLALRSDRAMHAAIAANPSVCGSRPRSWLHSP